MGLNLGMRIALNGFRIMKMMLLDSLIGRILGLCWDSPRTVPGLFIDDKVLGIWDYLGLFGTIE